MAVYLKVPFISQLNYGNGMNDPTGCWFCSAEMIGKAYESGPRMGVPEIHSSAGHAATGSHEAKNRLRQNYVQKALSRPRGQQMKKFSNTENEHKLLARREGLEPVPNHRPDWSILELENELRASGPLFFYWYKTPKGGGPDYGHASVVIGTDDAQDLVIYHDPESGRDQTMELNTFNSLRQGFRYGMMRRANARGAGLVTAREEVDLLFGVSSLFE